MLFSILITLYVLCSAALVIYGLHHYFVIWLFLRVKNTVSKQCEATEAEHAILDENAPAVLSQIPLYNEATVAERIIRAVAEIDYPRHIIQVLDDSNDETVKLVDSLVAELHAGGVEISVERRVDRVGYKAGALDYGMGLCEADYIAIFDSDFVPPVDFLRRTIPHFLEDEKCGVVQARWGHLNAEDSALTKAQSVGIDGHFVVEQVARSYNGYFLNFNGTAGVWRRTSISDAGGWKADTLTEDLDLSYRAQLKGWTIKFLPDLVVPAELPPLFASFRSQQFRWAKGSMQTAKKMLPVIWKSDEPLRKKVEATFHLSHYAIHLCMFLQAILALPIALIDPQPFSASVLLWFALPMGFAMLGPSLLYLVAELWISPQRWWHFFARLPMLLFIGFGICVSNARACLEGLIGIESPFVRTPKQGDLMSKVKYRGDRSYMPIVEVSIALVTLYTTCYYVHIGLVGVAPFFLLYTLGLIMVGVGSWKECRA